MIPVVIVLFGHFLVPETFVSQALAPLPFRLNPFQSLLIAVALVYLPFGLNLLNKIKITGGKVDNVNPRRQAAQLEATHPSFARLSAAEKNGQEAFPLFAAAVLAALQAGVSKELVGLYCTFWCVLRLVYVFIYAIQTNELVGFFRTATWGFSLMIVSKLLVLAAAQ
eukprot:TRINITY_DN1187_c0_g1_i5.p1 TRINITY_DN1187_c0_g1~~TRINITY_DN1187_c0_g1_i5.p1  ORF type:complete len:167 (-),score=50.09 TRINITY_DN1187_c0_g1_i5:219-719(-)